MKLLLTSLQLGPHGPELRALLGEGTRAALVFNALDQYDTRMREWEREVAALEEIGLQCEELDLRHYFGDEHRLADRLAELDLIWVIGGNTFVLARAMGLSGFRAAATPLLDAGRLVYAGYSAGACVTAPDLRGIELMDDASAVPARYPLDAPADALAWLPFRIVPHWRSSHGESSGADLAVEHLLVHGLAFRTLRDGDAIVIDGEPHSQGL